jgi:predicted dithiol-disulfide oxidoreductase (DUF899 family)
MTTHPIASREDWLAARKALLAKEKEFNRLRDQISAERRALPWVKIDKSYVFDGPDGKVTLADLFDGRSQLVIYHLMFHPDWKSACKSCSFWVDSLPAQLEHIHQRDVSVAAISRARIATIEAYKKRQGWTIPWVSSSENDFNHDFGVSFTKAEVEAGKVEYNYTTGGYSNEELPGISVFFKDEDGTIFHTYSTYARGLDMLNATYHYLDITPKGRDEDALKFPMEWVRIRDEYPRRARSEPMQSAGAK